MTSKGFSVRDLCYVGIFAALTAIMAQISIPLPYGVPMTMQTFAVMLAGIVLGPKRATIAMVVYMLLGAVGIPVFSGFKGGLGIILGLTGGFILTFPLMALVSGFADFKKNKLRAIGFLLIGTIINFAGGSIMYAVMAGVSFADSFMRVVLPFIPNSLLKIALALFVGERCRSLLEKSRIAV